MGHLTGDGPDGAGDTCRQHGVVPAPSQRPAVNVGFGWGFYGFFVAAVAWLAVYFLWAWRAAARDRAAGGASRGR